MADSQECKSDCKSDLIWKYNNVNSTCKSCQWFPTCWHSFQGVEGPFTTRILPFAFIPCALNSPVTLIICSHWNDFFFFLLILMSLSFTGQKKNFFLNIYYVIGSISRDTSIKRTWSLRPSAERPTRNEHHR